MKRADLVTCARFVGVPDGMAERLGDLVEYVESRPAAGVQFEPGANQLADLAQQVRGGEVRSGANLVCVEQGHVFDGIAKCVRCGRSRVDIEGEGAQIQRHLDWLEATRQ